VVAASQQQKLDPRLQIQLSAHPAGEMTSVIVTLKNAISSQQAAPDVLGVSRQERVIRNLQAQADGSQNKIKSFLQADRFAGKIGRLSFYWIINGFSLQATPEVIQALAARPDVDRILIDEVFQAPSPQAATGTAWDNLGTINAPQMWTAGFRGQGVVVANMDTGVDYTHPELTTAWRGGTNSWYDPADPVGAHPVPADLPSACGSFGHGTGTMGVMVGKTLGVAPQAQWIAVKIFNDSTCTADTAAITAGFQWLLDPDGNPATTDAPQVVNNSWGGAAGLCGSNPTVNYVFQPELQALQAAGISAIFAAGNYGPQAGSDVYPGNYPEAFPVGATDRLDAVASYSSRGPNSCVNPPAIYPLLAAPGTDIQIPQPGGGYVIESGTSFAAPHVAGALALLLSAFPNGLTLQQREMALRNSAKDLGATGPDNDFGYGRLDVWGAYNQYSNAQIGFASTSATVSEAAGVINVDVVRSGGLAYQASVDVAVSGGTMPPESYALQNPGTLAFAAEQTQKTISISLVHDDLPGPNKTLVLTLSNPQAAQVMSLQSDFILTVVDPDPWRLFLPSLYW
jgi:subtilisin family serine protease